MPDAKQYIEVSDLEGDEPFDARLNKLSKAGWKLVPHSYTVLKATSKLIVAFALMERGE